MNNSSESLLIESPEFRPEYFNAAPGCAPHPKNAVAALLIDDAGRYIMQLRDGKPEIFYPGHWGCFGGAMEANEDPIDALRRELREEIAFELRNAVQFTKFDFDFSSHGFSRVYRIYFQVRVRGFALEDFVLNEGADMKAFRGEELLVTRRVAPYDAFAIWMHMNKKNKCGDIE
jgi:8-oxo-dGTP pyrophosphatase MutT (NUDIX family)